MHKIYKQNLITLLKFFAIPVCFISFNKISAEVKRDISLFSLFLSKLIFYLF